MGAIAKRDETRTPAGENTVNDMLIYFALASGHPDR
jgi:hypothetical protein